jgi:hypothetical protein
MFRAWLFRPIKRWLERATGEIMSALLDAANKLAADIDAKVASDQAALDAANAKISDLEGQVAAAVANEADALAALAVLQAADAKIAPAA